ncbi:MAG TPA: hypothetical protein VLA83_14315, partial [Candidatus Binatia bacterium]|nr:hypothetical protein [Candidatus Binatia bacterium]
MVRPKTSSVVLQDVLKISFVSIVVFLIGCGGGAVTPPPVNNGPSQAVIALAVGQSTIIQGQSTTITWQVTNGVSFSISPAVASGTL